MTALIYQDIKQFIRRNAALVTNDGLVWYGFITGYTNVEDQSDDMKHLGHTLDAVLIGGNRDGDNVGVPFTDIANIIQMFKGERPPDGTYNL